jgi:hypothetical protein
MLRGWLVTGKRSDPKDQTRTHLDRDGQPASKPLAEVLADRGRRKGAEKETGLSMSDPAIICPSCRMEI